MVRQLIFPARRRGGRFSDGALLRMWLGEGDVHANMSGGEETRVKLAHLFSKEAHLWW